MIDRSRGLMWTNQKPRRGIEFPRPFYYYLWRYINLSIIIIIIIIMRSMPVLLRPEKRGRHVRTGVWQEPRRRYWRSNAVSGENESRTRA